MRLPLRALALRSVLAVSAALFVVVPGRIACADAHPAPDGFADLAASLLPAVVNISSSQTVKAGAGAGPEVPSFPPGSPFEQFFHDFMNRHNPHGGGGGGGDNGGGDDNGGDDQSDNGGNGTTSGPPRKMQSLGSGFIVDPSGIIVTNNHVIDGADEITVVLQDNTSLKATLLGHDDRTDMAVLQVHADHPLPAVAFGDSDSARVGNWVLAIGNPFGLGGSVTAGIVSARGRDIQQGPYDDFIQTDAPINRGNSGGPLFDMAGKVIGINTAIYSPSGGSIGIGFAIPASMAHIVVDQLWHYGHARRGWLGVRIQQVTPDIAGAIGLKGTDGAMVAGLNAGGPAEKAKLKPGDVILRFNNEPVKEMHNLPRIVAETAIDQSVPVTVWRDGHEQVLQVTTAEQPPEPALADAVKPKPAAPVAPTSTDLAGLGFKVGPITDDARQKYNIASDQKGVLVTEITADSAAADRGLKVGDVVQEAQQQSVANPDDLVGKVADLRRQGRKTLLLLVQGAEGMRWLPVPLDTAPMKKQG